MTTGLLSTTPGRLDPTDLEALAAELHDADRDDVGDVLAAARRVRSAIDAVEVRAHRRLRELAEEGRSEASERAIAAAADGNGRHGRQVAERDELCFEAPELEDALDEGAVSGAHLDAVAAAAKSLPVELRATFLAFSDELIDRAPRVTIDGFRRECRQLARQVRLDAQAGSDADELNAQRAASEVTRWTDRATGMHHTLIKLDPVRDAEMFAATAREVARLRQVDGNGDLTWKQLEAQAWVNCIVGNTTPAAGAAAVGGPVPSGSVVVDRAPQIIATTTVEHLRAEAERRGVCATSEGIDLPISTLRRLCCEAEIIPVVMNSDGVVLDQGRSKRTATAAQRHALRAMHSKCVFPGCAMSFESCRIHHVDWWGRDVGPTDLANLVPVCEHDHHRLHEGGWKLRLDEDRVATWIRPDGVVHHVGPTCDRASPASPAVPGAP